MSSSSKITVADVWRRYRWLGIPTMLFIAFGVGMGLPLCFIIKYDLSFWIFATGLFAGFLLAGIYYYWITSEIAIWGYDNVDNIHELFAIDQFTPYSGFYPITKRQKLKVKAIEEKLGRKRQFIDDKAIPDETVIYNAVSENYALMGIYVIFFCISLYFTYFYPFAILFTMLFACLGGVQYAQRIGKGPRLTFSNEGITLPASGLMSWAFITKEHIYISSNKEADFYLSFEYNGNRENIWLGRLSVEPVDIRHLLYIYRQRYTQQNPRYAARHHG